MNIIKSEQFTKEGNDCLIKYDISIIESECHYDVIYIVNVFGSWISEEQEHSYEIIKCPSRKSAEKLFKKLIDKDKK